MGITDDAKNEAEDLKGRVKEGIEAVKDKLTGK